MAKKKQNQTNKSSIDHLISDQAMVVSARHSQGWGPLYQRLYNLYCFQYICDCLISQNRLREIHSFKNIRRSYLGFDPGFADFVEQRLKVKFTISKRDKLIAKTKTKYSTLKRSYSRIFNLKQSDRLKQKARAQDFKQYFCRIALKQSQNQFSRDQVEYLELIKKLRIKGIDVNEEQHLDIQLTKSQVLSCEQNDQF